MKSHLRIVAPPSPCGYLPDQTARMEYEYVQECTPNEYLTRMNEGWRRFGHMLFRPQCTKCDACRSLRVPVKEYRPNRSQLRADKANQGVVAIRIGAPEITEEKLDLYDRYHEYQAQAKGWPAYPEKDPVEYYQSFVDNPFPTMEWTYYLADRLIAVGYVDRLPDALSAIYFFYDPDERRRSLGIWNVYRQLRYASRERLSYVYLGYYVSGCRSMEYKAAFVPNHILSADGWQPYRD